MKKEKDEESGIKGGEFEVNFKKKKDNFNANHLQGA